MDLFTLPDLAVTSMSLMATTAAQDIQAGRLSVAEARLSLTYHAADMAWTPGQAQYLFAIGDGILARAGIGGHHGT